ncbi:unnamed protein product [Calicophoron daubneyi]|uniref:Cas1p 10 TM acyl transferase domain-containing protein n=1 Tax=Calicophoron daubneyi TaxID=300641 RepID=A0AAV2TFH5_CALDB
MTLGQRRVMFIGGERIFQIYDVFQTRANVSKQCFIWMPTLNNTAVSLILKRNHSAGKSDSMQKHSPENCSQIKPSHIVLGPEPHIVESGINTGLAQWKDNLRSMADSLRTRNDLKIYWVLLDSIEMNQNSSLSYPPEDISNYNAAAKKLLSHLPFVTVFSGNRRIHEISEQPLNNQTSNQSRKPEIVPGSSTEAARKVASLLAYVIENRFANCCVMIDAVEPCQRRILNVYILITKTFELKILDYQYNWFVGSIIVLLLLGAIFIRRSDKVKFNNTDLTREWKGWMQLYIVIFHLFQGFENFCSEVFSRIVVSNYLCLSGFGHFSYYWKRVLPEVECKKIFKLNYNTLCILGNILWLDIKRYVDVMFRLNFLLLIVCTAMNERFMQHYFLPLVVFWFNAVAVCMNIFPRVSKATQYVNQSPSCADATKIVQTIDIAESIHEKLKQSASPTPRMLCVVAVSDKFPQIIGNEIFSWKRHVYSLVVMLMKIVLLAIIVTWIVVHRNVFDRIFFQGFHKRMFDWVPDYWYYRFANDCYSVIYGITFGLVYECSLIYQTYIFRAYEDITNRRSIPNSGQRCSFGIKMLMKCCSSTDNVLVFVPFGVIFLLVSILCYGLCNHQNYDMTNRLCNIFPFLSYLFLRNVLPGIRNHVSLFLARVGDMSMEVYILHRYVCTTALVKYLLAPDIVNLILQSAVLFCVADEAHKLTRKLHQHLVPQRPKELLWKGPTLCLLWYYLLYGF